MKTVMARAPHSYDEIYLSDEDLESIKKGVTFYGDRLRIQHMRCYPDDSVKSANLKIMEDLRVQIEMEIRRIRAS